MRFSGVLQRIAIVYAAAALIHVAVAARRWALITIALVLLLLSWWLLRVD